MRYSPEQWREYSETAHQSVFGKMKPASWDRISYALVVTNPINDEPIGYLTVRENDHESVYWQFGGAFPKYQKSTWAVRGYHDFIEYQKQFSKRAGTYVENTNTPMLKLALTYGFIPIGVRTVCGSTYVDLLLEFK